MPQYLVEWKPLHITLSTTVYADLRGGRHPRNAGTRDGVVAFGDPRYPTASRPLGATSRWRADEPDAAELCPDEIDDPTVRSEAERGFRFRPLDASRREVEAIASLYAPDARVYLDLDATEERAKALGKEARIVHFACHAVLNERFPLDSALALRIKDHPSAGEENGLLQAWEVFEQVRLDADLVTLSSCESGLGRESGGEGLLGLTRALQFAGARAVLGSLWKVEDEATFELMTRFYTRLSAGAAMDEALRLAQVEMIRAGRRGGGIDLSLPRHWAAFELAGDWK